LTAVKFWTSGNQSPPPSGAGGSGGSRSDSPCPCRSMIFRIPAQTTTIKRFGESGIIRTQKHYGCHAGPLSTALLSGVSPWWRVSKRRRGLALSCASGYRVLVGLHAASCLKSGKLLGRSLFAAAPSLFSLVRSSRTRGVVPKVRTCVRSFASAWLEHESQRV
jgi:hypothetical protein